MDAPNNDTVEMQADTSASLEANASNTTRKDVRNSSGAGDDRSPEREKGSPVKIIGVIKEAITKPKNIGIVILVALLIFLGFEVYAIFCNPSSWDKICRIASLIAAFLAFVCGALTCYIKMHKDAKIYEKDSAILEYCTAALAFLTVVADLMKG